jgi:2'-5' RNA ligase
MPPIRTFVALPIDEAARTAVARAVDDLSSATRAVRWVAPSNYHVTLAFLGDQPVEAIERIRGAVARATDGVRAFGASLDGFGAFPSLARASVIWVGVDQGRDQLTLLRDRTADELSREGYGRDERFHPHVTVGRVRPRQRLERAALARLESVASGVGAHWQAHEVVLFASRLEPDGPRYEPLVRVPLEP